MTQTRRWLYAIAAVAPIAACLVATPAHASTDTSPPQVLDIQLSPTTFAVSGLATKLLTVQVHLTDSGSGILYGQSVSCDSPDIVIQRVSGHSTGGPLSPEESTIMVLRLVSGTDNDGIWQGTLPVPSTYDGTWQVVNACVADNAGNETNEDPRQHGITRSFTVTGSRQPMVSAPAFAPDPLRRGDTSLTVSGSVTDSATGAGLPNVKLGIGNDNTCGGDLYFGHTVTTSAGGRWSYVIQNPEPTGFNNECPTLTGPNGSDINFYPEPGPDEAALVGFTNGYPRVQTVFLSAHPASTSVHHGTNDDVTGSVWPGGAGGRAILQRLVSGSWHNVNQALVRSSGRFTVVATPPAVGTNTYRVVRPSDQCVAGRCRFVGSVSQTFTITGT
jgi:hypothetical protein